MGGGQQDFIIALVSRIVAAEDPHKPLSDAAIVRQAREQGAILARRTVVTYRGKLGIAPSYARRAVATRD
ncbi:sigma-54-like protein [Rhodovulum imhoffii]|uniref:Sigma-54-like protein n=1 Tax=Rhodovulum imhoffii TaxID=365340 RepID=A0A2T5BRN0_9RHOB|nr:hypothetical protein [Rhodovulum imhoffii]MBK5934058.1 hypothetical protein [Rhodovulum imhoffii]PTN01943.1 sigma-54-like protein [Rhodovulum imhoffii]